MNQEIPYVEAPRTGRESDQEGNPAVPIDMLSTIFQGQRDLMAKYHLIEAKNGAPVIEPDDFGDLDSRTVQARLHALYGFTVRELSEAMQELKGKPWKQTYGFTDADKFREELADTFHFFVEMCITAGMQPEDLFDEYFGAWQKNRKRQENGY